jgi:uncharacterized peroxidase-related enzyme
VGFGSLGAPDDINAGTSLRRPSQGLARDARATHHSAALRRLTGLEHLDHEFATTWPTYELDTKTRALLGFAKKLTENPGSLEDADFDDLREAGWDERGIYQAAALISFFNFSGRLEAALGLPMDGQHLGDQLVRML